VLDGGKVKPLRGGLTADLAPSARGAIQLPQIREAKKLQRPFSPKTACKKETPALANFPM
jgi:hypothetical protein